MSDSESDNIISRNRHHHTVLRMSASSSHIEELLAEDPLATESDLDQAEYLADDTVMGDENTERCYTCHQELSPAPPLVIHVQQTSSNKMTVQVRYYCLSV